MKNLALKIAYDGTSFYGWQKTAMGESIEQVLSEVLHQILQEPIQLQAASRTDRGVHAEGQWINFITTKNPHLSNLQKSLNALLPLTIRVLHLTEVSSEFHPSLHVEKKEYHYHVCYSRVALPQERLFSWHIPYSLQTEKMIEASRYFIGEHDFSSFCNMRKNMNYSNKKRIIEELQLSFHSNSRLRFALIGNHFLYKMVRTIVGTLVYVGLGKIRPEHIPEIIRKESRPLAGVTAPAHGLTLKKIYYPQQFRLEI